MENNPFTLQDGADFPFHIYPDSICINKSVFSHYGNEGPKKFEVFNVTGTLWIEGVEKVHPSNKTYIRLDIHDAEVHNLKQEIESLQHKLEIAEELSGG